MFKFVVVFALAAAVAATPDTFISPLGYSGYSSNVIAPATTLLPSPASGVVYSSPVVSSPLAYSGSWNYPHFIKKRDVAVSSYIAPSSYITPYAYPSAPFATTYTAPFGTSFAAPLGSYSSPVYTATTAHLIKKRSAPFIVPSSYVAPTAYAATSPFFASTYAAPAPIAPYVASPYYASPYAQFIKK